MSIAELAALIVLVCGRGDNTATLDCRDLMVNCSVGTAGEIKKEQAEICVKRAKEMK